MIVWTFLTSSVGVSLLIAMVSGAWVVWQGMQPRARLESIKLAAETLRLMEPDDVGRAVVEERLSLELARLSHSNAASTMRWAAAVARPARVVLAFVGPIVVGLIVVVVLSLVIGPIPQPWAQVIGLASGVAAAVSAWWSVSGRRRVGPGAVTLDEEASSSTGT